MNFVIGARFGFRISCFVLLVFLVGCTKTDGGNRVPVAGKVTFQDGKPLPRGTVIFTPDPGKGNQSQHEPRGAIDADGNYKVETTDRLNGVQPGWYFVTIIAQEPYDES